MGKTIEKLIIAITGFALLTGCGSSSDAAVNSDYSGASDMSYTADSVSKTYDTRTEADIIQSTMMIIRGADISVDVSSLETFDRNLKGCIEENGGYFESSTINNYDSDYSTERYAYYTIRIPEKNLDAFLNRMDSESTVTNRSITSKDVSLEYVDTEARIKALEEEKQNLLRLMDQAETTQDVIDIEDHLTDVQYELDSKNNQKRALEGRVTFSTVTLNAREKRDIDNPMKQIFDVNLKEQAMDGLEEAVDASVGILVKLPVVIIVTAFIAFVLLFFSTIFKKLWKKIFKREGEIRYMMVPVMIKDNEPSENHSAAQPEPENKEDKKE